MGAALAGDREGAPRHLENPMRLLHRLRALLRNLTFRSAVDRELDEELQSYVELRADEDVASGMPAEIARRQARLQLGGVASVTDSVRSARAGAGLERLRQDLRYALRGLLRAPGYATAAILTLGLGIGANTAIFSIVDAAMFKPLPYRMPEQLVRINQVLSRGTANQTTQIGMTWDQVDRWRREPQVFSSIATYTEERVSVTGPQGIGQRWVSSVSPEMCGPAWRVASHRPRDYSRRTRRRVLVWRCWPKTSGVRRSTPILGAGQHDHRG